MKKRLFSFFFGSLLSGSQVQATIYAAAKLTKGDQTVYLLSDVDGETPDALVQKQIILDKVKEPETALIARDPCDIRLMKTLFPAETQEFLEQRQAETESVASDLKTLRQGLITMAYKHEVPVANIDFESVAFMQGLPFGEVKAMLNEIIALLKDQLPDMTPNEQKNFWQHVVNMNKINNTCISLLQKRDLTFLIARLEQLFTFNGVKLSSANEIVVCSTPEDIECLAFRLSKDGWKGDASNVVNFSASWGTALDTEDKQRVQLAQKKLAELNKLNAAIKKLKNKASRERLVDAFNKRWDNEFEADPIKRQNEVALQCSPGPVDLKAFFAGNVSQAASSNPEPQVPCVDADVRMNRVLELQNTSDMNALSQEEKTNIAKKVCQDLMPILMIKPEQGATDVVCMQIRAAELMAYFYMHAQEYNRACTSLCNAIGLGYNNGLHDHAPNTITSLADLIKTPEYKEQVLKWMHESGFEAEEQTVAIAELEQLACSYSSL